MKIYEKKPKKSLRGSITYGSGSRKKNRGSGNRGGKGNSGIWDHNKSRKKKIEKDRRRDRIKKRKKKKILRVGFLSSNKYLLKLQKRGIFIKDGKIFSLKHKKDLLKNQKFLNKLGYKLVDDKP